jgi:2-acylglycerol O-acyltransferase 2
VIFWSKWGPLPDPDTELNIVIGKPMELPLIESPTDEQITKYHDLYVQRIEQLFDTHKAKYASKDARLEIF